MIKNLPQYIAWTRKAIINVLGLLTVILTLDLLPDPYSKWVSAAIAILTAIIHFNVPNAPKPGSVPAQDADEDVDASVPEAWRPAELVTASHVAAKNEQAAPPPK